MGARLVKFEFCPNENEQIEALVKVPHEPRSVIHGVVVDCRNKPIKDAVVKLLEVLPGNPCRMKPLTHAFTDECGQFLFGPLQPNKKYAIKVWYSDVKIRELVISPDCNDPCDNPCDDYNNTKQSDTVQLYHKKPNTYVQTNKDTNEVYQIVSIEDYEGDEK